MRRVRIVITGVNGQVGDALLRSLAPLGELIPSTRDTVDLSVPGGIGASIRQLRPAIVVNAAAYTAVDRAESEPEQCYRVNTEAVREVAEAARRIGALVVHYSTDYVFDGSSDSPYCEDDPANPLNVYGASKWAGEEALRQVGGPHVVLRTSWVYGCRGNNFLRTVLRLARERTELRIVNDQVGAPTSSLAVADATRSVIAELAQRGELATHRGTYHLSAAGQTTWSEFARAILARDPRRAEHRCTDVTPISTAEYPTPARRPRYSVLDNGRMRRSFGVALPNWLDGLDAVFATAPDTAASA